VVFGVLGAKIGHEPTREAERAVPLQRVQVIADGVKSPLVGTKIYGLVDRVLSHLL
jgi:hypothetical protein